MQSQATTVDQYLLEQTPERRSGLEVLLEAVRGSIKPGFIETMRWGMISFEVPIELSGATYNSQPLNYIGIAVQKHHYSVYLMGIYMDKAAEAEFHSRWLQSGLKLDMGKACVRFRSLSHADLETIAWATALATPEEFFAMANKAQANRTR
jgi:hypothetical protein